MDSLQQSFSFLRQAPEDLLSILQQHGIKRTLPPLSRLYWEGDNCSHIAFVVRGEIRVFKTSPSGREITLYELVAGETCILNASCILSKMRYPADAITLTTVEAVLLPAEIFQQLIDDYSIVRNYVFQLLSQRLVEVFSLLQDIVFGKLDQRLLDYLVEKAENNTLQITHKAIAQDLGSSREVISRLLKDMEQKGLLRISRKKITLIEPPEIPSTIA